MLMWNAEFADRATYSTPGCRIVSEAQTFTLIRGVEWSSGLLGPRLSTGMGEPISHSFFAFEVSNVGFDRTNDQPKEASTQLYISRSYSWT